MGRVKYKLKDDLRFKASQDKLENLNITSGLHTRKEKLFLWSIAQAIKEGAVVEIGSFEGYSTIVLADAVNGQSEIFSIDPHTGIFCEADEYEIDNSEDHTEPDTWSKFNSNISDAGVDDKIKTLKLKSETAVMNWKKPISILFIDGSHKYDDVKKDLLLWKPFLIPGSIVIFHDLWIPGVHRVINDDVFSDNAFSNYQYIPCCMFATTYLSDKYPDEHRGRNIWRILFRIRGFMESKPRIKHMVNTILRWDS